MKNLLSISLLLFINLSFSQIKSGTVTYHIQNNNNTLTSNDLREPLLSINKEVGNIELILNFNRTSSSFGIKKELLNDSKNDYYRHLALLVTKSDKVFYVDSNKKEIIEKFSPFGEEIRLKSNYKTKQWTLSNISKKINNYTCYKASITIDFWKEQEQKFIKLHYTAWYCPQLNFNFGPLDAVGLPGLVLEFSNKKLTYYATKITLSDEDATITPPKEGKLITKDEYDTLAKKMYLNTQN
ncbi:GLPGLI family protein [Lacinutrix undariae]